MRFERRGDIKKSLSIGNAANPIEIADMYAADYSTPPEYRTHPESANIKKGEAFNILRGIEMGQVREWETRFVVGVYTGEEEIMKNGGILRKFELERLGDYKGFYILFQGKKFKMPV